jgi:hypothetical protein
MLKYENMLKNQSYVSLLNMQYTVFLCCIITMKSSVHFFTNILYLDLLCWSIPERIERFIEGQPFLQSYDSAPYPPPPSPTRKPDRRHTGRLIKRVDLLMWKGGGSVDPNQTTARKLGPLWIVQSSLVWTNGIKVCIFCKKMHGGRTVNRIIICKLARTCVCNIVHRRAIILYPHG